MASTGWRAGVGREGEENARRGQCSARGVCVRGPNLTYSARGVCVCAQSECRAVSLNGTNIVLDS